MARPSDLTRRALVIAITSIALAVAASWAPSFWAPLGDNHEGRVDARFALQVQNLDEHGWSESGWASSMAPYAGRYANHPPGPNAAQAGVAALVGRGATQVRIFPYLAGLLALPAAAWLLRTLGRSRVATIIGVALLASAPLYWCYGRLLWDVPLLFATPAAILTARRDNRRRLAATAALVAVTVLMSWIGAATAGAFLGVRQLQHRRRDLDGRATAVLAGSWLLGAGLAAAWFRAATTSGLVAQVEFRTSGGSFTTGEFLRRQADNVLDMVPLWTLALLPLGVWATWRTRRTDALPLATSIVLGALFVVALPNGSFIHDYWIYPLLVPLTVASVTAIDALCDRLGPRLDRTRLAGAATVVGSLLVATLAAGGVGQSYFRDPEDAGRLAARSRPSAGQEVAWTANGVGTARWLSWYWDLPSRPLDATDLATAPADDVVLVAWPLPASLTGVPDLDREGGYALVRVGDLRADCPDPAAGC